MRFLAFTLVAVTAAASAAAQMAPPPAAQTAPAPAPAGPKKTLSLPALVHDALAENLNLAAARSNTKATETDIRSASGAFDPRLDFTPSYTRTTQTLQLDGTTTEGTAPNNIYTTSFGGTLPFSTTYSLRADSNKLAQNNPAFLTPGTLSPSVNNTLSFGITQPLLRGIGPKYAKAPVNIAKYAYQSADARLQRTAEQTIADVETAYWGLGLAEAVERSAQDSYDRATVLLGRNTKMLDLKLISELDAITARRGEQQRLTTLTEATRRRQDAAERLLFLVYGKRAVEHLGDIDVVTTEPPPTSAPQVPSVSDLEKKALETRQDFRAAQIDLSQRELIKDVNHNALLPDLRLDANYGYAVLGTDSVGRFFDVNRTGDISQNDWKLGVSFGYPIGNRTAKAANARAGYDVETQKTTIATVENIVRNEVRASTRAIDSNRRRLEQAQRSLDYAKQQYDAGQKQLQLGLLDSFRLLQMEEDVTGSDLVLQQTRYDLAQSITDFDLANGNIDQKYQGGPSR